MNLSDELAGRIGADRDAMDRQAREKRLAIVEARRAIEAQPPKPTRRKRTATRAVQPDPPRSVAVALVRAQRVPRSSWGPVRTPRPVPDALRPRCRHCAWNVQCRPRGLCSPCFYSPARELYPPGSANPATAKYARRGIVDGPGRFRLPELPTTALPGTPEKLAVMEQRAEARVALFHPADARWPGDPRPREWMRTAAV